MATMIPAMPLDFHGSPGEQQAYDSLAHTRAYAAV
jgi:hypothetical protein